MPNELAKAFQPNEVETKLYQLWEENNAFKPNLESNLDPFTIIMPPPNANGALHIGHAVFVTLQDIMIRYHRMLGQPTLWLPGSDHAGFETQVVYTKYLDKQGRNWFNIPHHQLYEEIKEFTLNHKTRMIQQLRALGASADWSRERFTLDPRITSIVYDTFLELYQDDLVYRGDRIINWCPKHQTSLSDLETKYEDREDAFYYFKFGPFTIGTARPETKFGTQYVVVHPADTRYKDYEHGQKIPVDWIDGAIEATIIKDESVDPEFGSGAMTITPWHSQVDFDIALRHNLKLEQIIDKFGKLLPIAQEFEGQKIAVARPQIVEKLKAKGLLLEDKTDYHYHHQVSLCYKCNTVIEPQISPQWFVAMTKKIENDSSLKGKSLQDLGLEAIKNKEIEFVTPHFEKTYFNWLDNLRDWNISRQIVWGIQLPVWYCQCGETTVAKPNTGKITFMRHGQAQHNELGIGNGDPTKEFHLTEKGKKQVETALQELVKDNISFDQIYASQMIRTQETAQYFADKFKQKVKIDPRLNDIVLNGLEGQKIEEIHAKTHRHKLSVEGSETLDSVINRLASFIKDHLQDNHQDTLVITSMVEFDALKQILQNHPVGEKITGFGTQNADHFTLELSDLTICQKCQKLTANRDQDVFDTWFSSGQWPFATLMSQDNKDDFSRFYPTSVMETGHDIIFFWIARMIMLGKYKTQKPPFKKIYLNGLVRDKDRQKMSKSKGNVVDPLGVAETYGADAVRMALVFNVKAGSDIIINEQQIKGMRNFANKVWNIGRFIISNLDNQPNFQVNSQTKPQTEADKTINNQLQKAVKDVSHHIDNYRFHEAAQAIYGFIWNDLADVYLEESKAQITDTNLTQSTLNILLESLVNSLKLLHPFMPYVSESLWQELVARNYVTDKLLITSNFPKE